MVERFLRYSLEHGRKITLMVADERGIRRMNVTVTAMDEIWMCISSWGKKYYINRQEYMEYACRYSGFLVSNMVYLLY